ncbi:hypothetical protein NQ315_006087 [Exocentrus adspersus]|uniref:Transposase n=1 Tax=Exocentrus adspersus TaxID=1586481 RepID=A0AAV8VDN6_9CUCU|nr:hypothetical protein NQ315_006087 [Exocentrus adspersus]
MATYSQTEKREMYELYISNNKNAARAAQEYEFLYPERRQPDRTTFLKIYRNMVECGSVQKSRGRYQARRERVNEINVLAQVHVNPEGSTLNFARECGISSTTVKRILKDNHYHDYKFKPVQTLYPGDGDRRVAFCRWLQTKLMADINYSRKIIWSDETTFTNSGIFNRKNKHYYATENPHLKQETRPQIRFHINVWCGILDDTIIGPFIIDGNLNSQKYLQLLETQLEDALDHLPLRYVRNLEGFQQDSAGPHNAALAMRFYIYEIPMVGNEIWTTLYNPKQQKRLKNHSTENVPAEQSFSLKNTLNTEKENNTLYFTLNS